MNGCLLDTHAAIWFFTGDSALLIGEALNLLFRFFPFGL